MNRRIKQWLDFWKKNSNVCMLLVLAASVLLYQIGEKLGQAPELQEICQKTAFSAGLISAMYFYLTKTRTGKEMWRSFVEPLLKPHGEETRYWNEDGSLKGEGTAEEPEKKEDRQQRQPYLWVVLPGFVIMLCVCFVIAVPAADGWMAESDQAAESLIHGIFSGNPGLAAEGMAAFLKAVLLELKNFLILAVVVVAFLLAAMLVYRVFRCFRRDVFTDEEDEEK